MVKTLVVLTLLIPVVYDLLSVLPGYDELEGPEEVDAVAS